MIEIAYLMNKIADHSWGWFLLSQNYGHVPMLEAKAHLKLTEIVQKWFILRRVSVCCQPFVSTADRREHTLGRCWHAVFVYLERQVRLHLQAIGPTM